MSTNVWHMCFSRPFSALALIIALGSPALVRANIELTVTRVGFPSLSGPIVRNGSWTPVVVNLSLLGKRESFDGTLRISQLDNDGDECFDQLPVHLRQNSGGGQDYTLYVPANPVRGQGKFIVELLDDKGDAVEVVSSGEKTFHAAPTQQPGLISDDELLILDISRGSIGPVKDLADIDKRLSYNRILHIAHFSPVNLPEHWIGLEAVDHIVWDDAQPETVTTKQLSALLEWVKEGGVLLIAASRSAGSLLLCKPLATALPVELGDLVTVENLRAVRQELVEAPYLEEGESATDDWLNEPFSTPVPVLRCTLREGARGIAYETVQVNGELVEIPVVSRRRFGRGHIIFCAVTIKDLFSAPGRATEFFEKLFYVAKLENPDQGRPFPAYLFNFVVGPISFSTSGGLYLFLAGVSSVAYVVLATFGTWGIVSNRGWRQHSWSAFGIAAVASSVLAWVVVQSRQGFGETLRQVSIIDAVADDTMAQATTFFGLKTSSDKRLDLWLPADPLGATEPTETSCFLRPLPGTPNIDEPSTSFANPGEYRLKPANALIEGVRLRATLKTFEGRWRGALSGRLFGEVSVRRGVVSEESYLINDLGVDLKNCWLFVTDTNPDEKKTVRASGDIYAFDVGDFPADGKKVFLHGLCFPPGSKRSTSNVLNQSTLASRHGEWEKPFVSLLSSFGMTGVRGVVRPNTAPATQSADKLGSNQKALLLLSTIGDYDPGQSASAFSGFGQTIWSRDRVRNLDLRSQLQTDSVFLVGFADDPGPVRLFRRIGKGRFRSLKPDLVYSKSMYRIRIPAHVSGDWSPGDDDEQDELDKLLESKGL